MEHRLELQRAQPSDAEQLAALRSAAMRPSLERIGRFDAQRARERFLSGFASQHTRHIVWDGVRVGVVVVRPAAEAWRLDHLYLLPAHQGAGIGAAVLQRVCAEADAAGRPLHVGALKQSAANRFYLRHGFRLAALEEWDNLYIRPPHAACAIAPIEFATERLRLRQWRPADLAPFAALNADSRVMEFLPAPLTRAQSDALAERCAAQIAARGWGWWAVEEIASGAFIGFVGLQTPAAPLPFSPCVEVGWRLAFPYWGKGYASEAARGALRIGFDVFGLDEIVSFTVVANRRSRAVMERLGMRPAGSFAHPSLPADSPLRTHCLYRLAR